MKRNESESFLKFIEMYKRDPQLARVSFIQSGGVQIRKEFELKENNAGIRLGYKTIVYDVKISKANRIYEKIYNTESWYISGKYLYRGYNTVVHKLGFIKTFNYLINSKSDSLDSETLLNLNIPLFSDIAQNKEVYKKTNIFFQKLAFLSEIYYGRYDGFILHYNDYKHCQNFKEFELLFEKKYPEAYKLFLNKPSVYILNMLPDKKVLEILTDKNDYIPFCETPEYEQLYLTLVGLAEEVVEFELIKRVRHFLSLMESLSYKLFLIKKKLNLKNPCFEEELKNVRHAHNVWMSYKQQLGLEGENTQVFAVCSSDVKSIEDPIF